MATYDLNNLLPYLRLKLGDTVPATYRYADEWLIVALKASVSELSRWWNFKYLLNTDGDIYRNPNITFKFDETVYGVLEPSDDQIIVILAAIITMEGSLESSAWDAVSWRDNEISFSNLERFRTGGTNLERLLAELETLILPPTKKLAGAKKGSLPGYLDNVYERIGSF